MSLSEAIDATPDVAMEVAATEVASAIAVVAAAFREVGLVTDGEVIFPFVDLILSRADAAGDSFDDEEDEDEEDPEPADGPMLVIGA